MLEIIEDDELTNKLLNIYNNSIKGLYLNKNNNEKYLALGKQKLSINNNIKGTLYCVLYADFTGNLHIKLEKEFKDEFEIIKNYEQS